MGIGMVIAMDAQEAPKALDILSKHGERASIIGQVTDQAGKVEIV